MRGFGVLLVVLAAVVVIGCGGDGDGGNAEDVAPAGDVGAEFEDMPVYKARGSASVPLAGGSFQLAAFTVDRPGVLEARVSWEVGPDVMAYTSLHHLATHTIDGVMGQESPAIFTMAVTEDLVNAGDDWTLSVGNLSGPDAEVRYSVKFTPD